MMIKNKKFLFIISALILLTLLGVSAVKLIKPDVMSDARGSAMATITKQFPKNIQPLGELVVKNYREYRGNATRWSFVYFSSLFLAAVFSASAGIIIKLQSTLKDEAKRSDIAAICGATGALLITISGIGGFEQKWRTNRTAAAEMENLAYAILANPSKEMIIKKIQNINEKRLLGIVQQDKGNNEDKPTL